MISATDGTHTATHVMTVRVVDATTATDEDDGEDTCSAQGSGGVPLGLLCLLLALAGMQRLRRRRC